MIKSLKMFFILVILLVSFLFVSCGSKVITDLNKIPNYLSSQKKLGSSVDTPVPLVVEINLQNTVDEESNWHKLLKLINTSGLYVTLDLSRCTMPGTDFNPDASEETGKKFIVSLVLPDTTETIAGNNSYVMFRFFENMTTVSAKKAKTIQVAAFRGTKLTSVNFPEVIELGLNSFYGCTGLSEVSFPNVITIGNGAFRGCTNLVSIDFPKAEIIGNGAFINTALATIQFPAVKEIGDEAFSESITLVNASFPVVTKIGGDAFLDCKFLLKIDIPLVETIEIAAFANSGIESIDIPLATSIGTSAFYGCNELRTATLGTLSSINFLRVETRRTYWETTNYHYFTFPGNLREVYLGEGGGAGTYVKDDKGNWTKTEESVAL